VVGAPAPAAQNVQTPAAQAIDSSVPPDVSVPGSQSQVDPPAAAAAQSPTKPAPVKPDSFPPQPYWIDPDRPHIADSSVNVPKGYYLQENGFQQTWPGSGGAFDIPETLMRLGVLSRTELRFNVPNYLLSRTGAPHVEGWGDIQAGFKHRLGPLFGDYQIAVNPYISIPTGAQRVSSKHVDPNIKFPWSKELGRGWDMEGMQSIFMPTINGKRNVDWQTCVVLNRSWGRKKNAFIEYAGDVISRHRSIQVIHFGAAYRPNRFMQIDTQFGFRMSNAAPVAFLGFGYSYLLGR
jgi:hypothetical protein